MRFMRQPTVSLLAMAMGLTVAVSAQAETAADFYKGKTVTLIIGAGESGSYTAYARTLGRHLGKHIPGNPKIRVQNMTGGGGVTMVNHLYNKVAKDGTFLGAPPRTTHLDPLLFTGKYQFDATKLNWIGSLDTVTNVVITWHTSGVKNFADLKAKEVTLAAEGARTDSVIFSRMLNAWAGTKLKPVAGYQGSGAMFLAMERGEVDGRGGVPWATVKASKGDWVKDKKINVALQLATQKDPELPNVDSVLDHVTDPAHRAAFELLFSRQEMGRPYFTSPDVPADRVKALRDAFAATTKDPEFRAELDKQKFDLVLRTGEEVQAIVKRAYETDKATVKTMNSVLAGS